MVAFNSICKEKQYDRVYYMVTFRSIYKFKILVFCFGGWFIGAYL